MRYVLRMPFTWGEELARFLQIWLTFMGASLAFLVGGHASIQMLLHRLPEKARRMTRVGIALLAGLFFLILAVQGMRFVLFTWSEESPALSLSFGIVYLALPVASGIIFLTQMRDIWQLFQPDGRRDPESG
jgi:TRAP-type C4-dicarboxylate transport system permease small subunit